MPLVVPSDCEWCAVHVAVHGGDHGAGRHGWRMLCRVRVVTPAALAASERPSSDSPPPRRCKLRIIQANIDLSAARARTRTGVCRRRIVHLIVMARGRARRVRAVQRSPSEAYLGSVSGYCMLFEARLELGHWRRN